MSQRRKEVVEFIFNYKVVTDDQVEEQIKSQEKRITFSSAENAKPAEYNILSDIFLNLKHLKRGQRDREKH